MPSINTAHVERDEFSKPSEVRSDMMSLLQYLFRQGDPKPKRKEDAFDLDNIHAQALLGKRVRIVKPPGIDKESLSLFNKSGLVVAADRRLNKLKLITDDGRTVVLARKFLHVDLINVVQPIDIELKASGLESMDMYATSARCTAFTFRFSFQFFHAVFFSFLSVPPQKNET
jgi:hypothetical protein